MNKFIGAVSVLSMAITLIFAQSKPTFGDVIINNVISPFTAIQIGPGHRYGGPDYYGGRGYYSGSDYYGGPGYYSGPGYYDRSSYYGGRRGRCWVTTDRDRNYGYWGPCR